MRRTILIVPGLLSDPESESFLRQKLPAISALAEIGSLCKVAPPPPSETPEAQLLGLGADSVRLRQGPLTVSAFGFDPPERATHFHLSLMSFADGIASIPNILPSPADVDAVMSASKRLSTKTLTLLTGEGVDHGLVWEALGDLGSTSAAALDGRRIVQHLPEGDGEAGLRRLIDDSVNLLSGLELNARRVDEGLPPFNLLWPWGHGTRTPVPNLALRRGEPAAVDSASLRLAGLTRLAGYRHGDRQAFGRGLQTKFRSIARRALDRDLTIVYIDAAVELRARNMPEELHWVVTELDRELVQPLLDSRLKTPSRICLLCPSAIDGSESAGLPGSQLGLAAAVESGVVASNPYPFDERSLEERLIPTRDLWELVEAGIAVSA